MFTTLCPLSWLSWLPPRNLGRSETEVPEDLSFLKEAQKGKVSSIESSPYYQVGLGAQFDTQPLLQLCIVDLSNLRQAAVACLGGLLGVWCSVPSWVTINFPHCACWPFSLIVTIGQGSSTVFSHKDHPVHTYFSPLLLCGRSPTTSWWLLLIIPARITASFLLVSGHKEPECPSINHSLQLNRVPIAFLWQHFAPFGD